MLHGRNLKSRRQSLVTEVRTSFDIEFSLQLLVVQKHFEHYSLPPKELSDNFETFSPEHSFRKSLADYHTFVCQRLQSETAFCLRRECKQSLYFRIYSIEL